MVGLKKTTMFSNEIKFYQAYILNYGRCPLCSRELRQGELVHVGTIDDGEIAVACEKCKTRLSIYKQYIFHPKDYNVPNKDVLLWRYQDLPKFISLIDSKKLFFTRADKFDDPFEGARGFNFQKDAIYSVQSPYLTLKARNELKKAGKSTPTDAEVEAATRKEMQAMLYAQQEKRKEYFISCWHSNEMESEAMWKLYITAKNQGVAIQTTMERLCTSIESTDFEVGEVKYISFEAPLDADRVPIWYKRTAFQHEKEIRAIIRKPELGENGLPIDVDVERLIEKVYISPSAPSWFACLVENVLKKYGLNKEVLHSKLDEEPIY